MSTINAPLITEAQKQQFRDEGYFTLERCVPEQHLQLLRANCQAFIDAADQRMIEQGVDRLGLDARGKRYFASRCYNQRPELGQFIFSELMAEICRATIGDEAMLFWDQYVVKGTDKDSTFSWHQDSGFVHMECPMYLTCWITLDDVTLENGTVFLLPYSQVGIRTLVRHIRDERTNDMVGYFGKDPGVPVIIPAGSIAVFSSYVFHRSGPNLTDRQRRVFLAQYAQGPISNLDGAPHGLAVPFLKEGKVVWEGA